MKSGPGRALIVVAIAIFASCAIPRAQQPPPPAAPPEAKPPTDEAAEKAAAAERAKIEIIDKVPGFADVPFGAEFPAEKFQLEQDRGKLKLYKKTGEKLLIGPALLEAIVYHVYDGNFYGVALHTNDGQDSLALKEIMVEAFGSGENSAGNGPSTIWISKKNGALFDLNLSSGAASLFIFDRKLHDAVLSDHAASIKTAAQELIQGKP